MKPLAKPAAKLLEIGAESAGQRLDNFLVRELKGAPKSLIYRVIRSGEVRVNRGRARPDTRLEPGDAVRIPPLNLTPEKTVAPRAARAGAGFPVLHEDEALLVVDKPAGVAVHGGSGVSFGVIEALRAARPQAKFLELVHRIDRDTSGILVLAKSRPALLGMHERLREGRIDKRYLALVTGVWPYESKHHITIALARQPARDGERRVAASDEEGAKEAHSVVSVARRFAEATLLDVQIRTGRTHQIRVHLAGAGHPIVGDDKYGDFKRNREAARDGFRRMFLHAARISFLHPLDGTRLRIEAPLPPECTDCLAVLTRPARTPKAA